MGEKTLKKRVVTPAMLLVTIGVVYGDIGTSPMYVLKSIIENNGGLQTVNRAFIIGSLSLIIWTVTLITTVKYVVVAMKADNNGEGGIFALYSLVKNYGKYLVIPAMLGGAALLAAFAFSTMWRKKDPAQGRVLTLGLFAALAFLPSSCVFFQAEDGIRDHA